MGLYGHIIDQMSLATYPFSGALTKVVALAGSAGVLACPFVSKAQVAKTCRRGRLRSQHQPTS